jgi:hypothetical protein
VKLEPLSLTAINSIIRLGVATRCMLARRGQSQVQYTPRRGQSQVQYTPRRGQSQVQYTPRRGPCRTYSRCASRRSMFKYVHYLVYIYCSNCRYRALSTYAPSYDQQLLSLYVYKFVTVLITGVYFFAG